MLATNVLLIVHSAEWTVPHWYGIWTGWFTFILHIDVTTLLYFWWPVDISRKLLKTLNPHLEIGLPVSLHKAVLTLAVLVIQALGNMKSMKSRITLVALEEEDIERLVLLLKLSQTKWLGYWLICALALLRRTRRGFWHWWRVASRVATIVTRIALHLFHDFE